MMTDSMHVRRIIKDYYEQLHAHKFDNIDEIDQCLERHKQNLLMEKYIT